ncbi:MAG: hypothetical protein JXQ87_14950 [Bacteroidia bacterium]
MSKKVDVLLRVVVFCFLLLSCKTHYTPTIAPVYSFTGAKQANINTSLAQNGIELQAAFSVSKNIYLSGLYEGAFYSEQNRFRLYGLGLGYYGVLGNRGRIGLGSELQIGNIGARDITSANNPRDHVIRLLANGYIGTEFRLIEYYAGFRMGNYSFFGRADQRDIAFRFEPTATIKIGPGRFKLITQIGLSIPTTGWNDLIPMAHIGFTIDTYKMPQRKKN